MSNRPEVVAALVEAHRSETPVFALAAVDFEFQPSPTADERAEARRVVLGRPMSDPESTDDTP